MVKHTAKTKAGREWIQVIVRSARHCWRESYDAVLGETTREKVDPVLMAKFVEIDGRSAIVYEISDCVFVIVSNGGGTGITRYVIHTCAIAV